MALEFNDGNWEAEVINSDVPVLVDFLGGMVRSM